MTKKIAMVFPGQGSQSLGMLSELAKDYPVISQMFFEASDILNYDLWDIIQNGPVEKLNQTEITQPALLTASFALFKIWQENIGIKPIIFAGHSLGEYSAFVCADSITFREAVNLVAKRGQYMQEAVPIGQGAMAAIIGLTVSEVEQVCAESAQGQIISPANLNAPGQIVIAGNSAAVDRAMVLAKAAGAKLIKRLDVSVPSHCELMRSAAEKLGLLLDKQTWVLPNIPIVQNADAMIHTELTKIKNALFRQLFSPVRWVESIELIANQENKLDMIIECGPGKTLSGLNKRITDIPVFNIAEPGLFNATREALI